MRITRTVTVLVLLFTLAGYGASGNLSQNPRQGTDPVFSASHQALDLLKARTAPGSKATSTIPRVKCYRWGNLKWPDKRGHGTPPCRDDELDGFLDRMEGTRGFGGSGLDPWHLGRHYGKQLTPYLFTGRRFENFPGFYFNRNRYYNPVHGRFVTKDPIGFGGGENLWMYGKANPNKFFDPQGLFIYVTATDRNTDSWYWMTWKLWWALPAGDLYNLWTNQFSSYESLFEKVSEIGNAYGIGKLFFIGHGRPGVFQWKDSPPSVFIDEDIYNSTRGVKIFNVQCAPPSLSTHMIVNTYFFSCNSADSRGGSWSIAQEWANATKSTTYGVTGLAAWDASSSPVDAAVPWTAANWGRLPYNRHYSLSEYFYRARNVKEFKPISFPGY